MNFHVLCEGGLEAEGTATLLTLVRSFPVPTKPILLIHCVYTCTDSLSVTKNPKIINTLCTLVQPLHQQNQYYQYTVSPCPQTQYFQYTVPTLVQFLPVSGKPTLSIHCAYNAPVRSLPVPHQKINYTNNQYWYLLISTKHTSLYVVV